MITVSLSSWPCWLLAFLLKVFSLFSSPLRSLLASLSSMEILILRISKEVQSNGNQMKIKWKLDGNPFELEMLPKRFRIHLTSLPSSPLRILVPALFTSSLAALLGQTHRQCCNSQQRYYLVKRVISIKESASGDVCALQQSS